MAQTKLPGNLGYLDWSDWVRGCFSAAISGGAGAVSSGFGTMIVDPKDFNVYTGKIYLVMLASFTFAAVIELSKYLHAKPIPDVITEITTKRVEIQPTDDKPNPPAPVVTTTVKETRVEPISAGDNQKGAS